MGMRKRAQRILLEMITVNNLSWLHPCLFLTRSSVTCLFPCHFIGASWGGDRARGDGGCIPAIRFDCQKKKFFVGLCSDHAKQIVLLISRPPLLGNNAGSATQEEHPGQWKPSLLSSIGQCVGSISKT